MSKNGRGKNNWARTWINQTDLGREFGLSSVAIGKRLSELGLKDGREATVSALADGFAVAAPLANGIKNFRWNRERCLALLSESGLHRLDHRAVREAKFDAEARSIAKEISKLFDDGQDKLADLYWQSLDPRTAARVEAILYPKDALATTQDQP